MYDVVALGELLIDFTPVGFRQYKANAGGAPANVLAAVSKLGGKAAFIGTVGKDNFGEMLKQDLEDQGIDTRGLSVTGRAPTTLAFVHLDETGNRSFSFVRNPGADLLLDKEHVDYSMIDDAKIFHFGSISMTGSPSREATIDAISYARRKQVMVSFDPNLRPLLWQDLNLAKQLILNQIKNTDILKISSEEMEFLTGDSELKKGSQKLFQMGPKAVFITLGPAGCFYRYDSGMGSLPTYDTKVVDTTGAGDAFLGGVLYKLLQMKEYSIGNIPKDEFEKIVDFGNCTGALAAAKKGSISVMPGLDQVRECMRTVPKLQVQ